MKESTSFQETTHSQEGGSEEATRSLELGKEPGCKQTGWCGGGRCKGPAVARLGVVLRMGVGAIAGWREGRAVGSLEGSWVHSGPPAPGGRSGGHQGGSLEGAWVHGGPQLGSAGLLLTCALSPQYMGCIEVLRSMRSLDFSTRTQVTR